MRVSRANEDDGLSLAPLGRVERCDGIGEEDGGSDVGAESSVPDSLHDLTQLGAVGLDNEIDCQAVCGARLDRTDDGHQRSAGLDDACGPLLDVAADDV